MRSTAGRLAAVKLTILALLLLNAAPVAAQSYQRISGEGSSWSQIFIDAMKVNVKQFGLSVDYGGTGSSTGRNNWLRNLVDFAASDIPFQFKPEDGSTPENPTAGTYAYIPVTAGGTAFMYNLKINGKRVTNLRLSGENVAKIFTSTIKKWNDPVLQADNPGLTLPDRAIVPVVRSDGSGSSAQFTRWMIKQHGGVWQDHCERSGRAPACGLTSFYPTVPGMIAQSGDTGVATYVAQAQAEGAIGYVNYAYAVSEQFPVAKVLNAGGYYTEPTPENVAVSLLKARINSDEKSTEYLTQVLDDVYTDSDPRSYQLSSYSYLILTTRLSAKFTEDKGRTLGAFAYYAMCQGQQESASLGFSPMPINLVEASFDQIRKIPGVVAQDINIQQCKNPTFSADGTNTLAAGAPQPKDCDRKGPTQCATGTAGAQASTPASGAGPAGGAPAGGGAATAGGAGAAAAPAAGSAPAPGAGPAAAAAARAGSATRGGATALAASAGDGTAVDGKPDGALVVVDPGEGSDLGDAEQVALGAPGPTTTVLTADRGWGGAQTMMLLVGALTLAVVLLPPLAWRRLTGARPGRGRGAAGPGVAS